MAWGYDALGNWSNLGAVAPPAPSIPKNPYFTPRYSSTGLQWGDFTDSHISGYDQTPAGMDFDSWVRQFTDPAYRQQFAYTDDNGQQLNALPSLTRLSMAGYFRDQFPNLTPAQQEWIGYNIAREQEAMDDHGASDLMVAGMLAAPIAGIAGAAYGGAAESAAAGGTATGTAGGVSASGGALMPAAVPETAGTLSSWGLAETAPGVWAAPGAAGYAGAPSAGGLSTPMSGQPINSTFSPSSAATDPRTGAALSGTGSTLTSAGTTGGLTGALSSPQVLGMGAGALLGAMGGGGKSGTIQTEEGIPDWLQPYVKPALDKYSAEVQNYNVDPYGIMPGAMQEFKNTVGGMYLDPSTNKYLEDYFRLGAERIKGSLSPTFGHMQAFGQHSGYNEALSRGLGDYATQLYGGAYERERDRQNQMIAAAPAFLGQNAQAQFQPYSQYLTSIGQLGKKKDEPYFTNPFGNILGGAMTGAAFGRMFA